MLKSQEIHLEKEITDGYVTVESGRITEISREKPDGAPVDLSGYILLPGFVDIHFHGGNGYDVMDSTAEAIQALASYKIREGVTSFCPTTVTDTWENTMAAVANVREWMRNRNTGKQKQDGAGILGIFLEGPYINPKMRGAHTEHLIRPVSPEELVQLIHCGEGIIRYAAIAPELSGAPEAIRLLGSKGIAVGIGHSAASYAEAETAIQNGAKISIHTYNAMSPLHHREPGMVGAVLNNPAVYCEVICDFIHVHPAAVSLLLKAKGPDRVVLVTDSMMAGGLTDGTYQLGAESVTVKRGEARTQSGALAGSTLTLAYAVRNLVDVLGVPLFEAARMASLTPAAALGADRETGSIQTGKRADIIALDANLNVRFVMVGGEILLDLTH